jgi:hypothetical protein
MPVVAGGMPYGVGCGAPYAMGDIGELLITGIGIA